MKKWICLLLAAAICLSMSACFSSEENPATEPQISQMRSICELATMKCYYHNVAKYNEENASGILWMKKDRQFWVEYAGVVWVGIDASLVTIEIDSDNNVTITIPPAKVIKSKVDEATLTEDSFIVAAGSAKVEAEHQTLAFKEAQDKMEAEATSNTALLANAQQRVQKLLEDYVNNIGKCVGKEYHIKWVYVDDPAASEATAATEAAPAAAE